MWRADWLGGIESWTPLPKLIVIFTVVLLFRTFCKEYLNWITFKTTISAKVSILIYRTPSHVIIDTVRFLSPCDLERLFKAKTYLLFVVLSLPTFDAFYTQERFLTWNVARFLRVRSSQFVCVDFCRRLTLMYTVISLNLKQSHSYFILIIYVYTKKNFKTTKNI